jgi:tetratricopeptide (TPR) repeat protein
MFHTDNPQVAAAIGLCLGTAACCLILLAGKLGRRRRLAPLNSFLDAYRRGDFAQALQITETLPNHPHSRQYWFLRGGALMQLGRLNEAEQSFRQAVALAQQNEFAIQGRGIRGGIGAVEKEIKLSALHVAALGDLYLEQGRYGEATRCFEASLRDWPGHGPFHSHLAEACLRRSDPPAEALQWATLAVEEDRAGKGVLPEAYNMNLCEDLGTLAWAVAVASHDRPQVDRLVDEAVKLAGTLSVPTSAQVHFQSGLAYAALGDEKRSSQYLEEAARIDPQGRWGRAARAQAAVTENHLATDEHE